MPRNRADELTYYDELGVARDAASEQIREAFRGLVRLLHPDQHTDEHLKSVAELQMRKLNRIYAVLSDGEKRRAYDDYLEEDHGPASPLLSEKLSSLKLTNIRHSRLMGRLAWLGAVAIGGVLLIWLASDQPAGPAQPLAEKPVAPAPRVAAPVPVRGSDAAGETDRLREALRVAQFERDSAIHELAKLRSSPVPAPRAFQPAEPRRAEPQASAPVATLTELPAFQPPFTPLIVGGTAVRTPQPRLPARPFHGFWFFTKSAEDKKNPGLYPPEFIEATIVEQNGQIQGHYRSRYRIVDRAISPDVNFDFKGPVNVASNTVTAIWTGAGGAIGELTIKLVGEHSMKVDWSADRLGSIQGLTSGTASLTRREDQR